VIVRRAAPTQKRSLIIVLSKVANADEDEAAAAAMALFAGVLR
jgi:hypothetical protein